MVPEAAPYDPLEPPLDLREGPDLEDSDSSAEAADERDPHAFSLGMLMLCWIEWLVLASL